MKLLNIICTFNPRRDKLSRRLVALCARTLPVAYWGLIIVDNNSSPAVAS